MGHHHGIVRMGCRRLAPYYDWMALEAGAVGSFEPSRIESGALNTWVLNQLGGAGRWVDQGNTLGISWDFSGSVPTGNLTALNGKPALVSTGGGGGFWTYSGAWGSGTFTSWAGGASPKSFGVLAVLNPSSVAALNSEATSYNNDSIITDDNFRYGFTVGYDSTGAIGGGASGDGLARVGYYLCLWIFNGATFQAGYCYIGATLPALGFVAYGRYNHNGASSTIICSVNGVDGSTRTVSAMSGGTTSVHILRAAGGFGDDDQFLGMLGQLSFKDNSTNPAAGITAIKNWWGIT